MAISYRIDGNAGGEGACRGDRKTCSGRGRGTAHSLLRVYMIAAPPGTYANVTGNSRSGRVTVRAAMMPTVDPNTTSLRKWRLSFMREIATYVEKMYAGTAPFHPRCRSRAVANAKLSPEWPEGKDNLSLPSGRSRCVASFIAFMSAWLRTTDVIKSIPTYETFR